MVVVRKTLFRLSMLLHLIRNSADTVILKLLVFQWMGIKKKKVLLMIFLFFCILYTLHHMLKLYKKSYCYIIEHRRKDDIFCLDIYLHAEVCEEYDLHMLSVNK